MSNDLKESINAIANIPFEAVTSKTIDETEEYHARIMRDVILNDLENKLRDAVKKRSNTIYFWLENYYSYEKSKPHHGSVALSEGLKAIRNLPWVAHAEFNFEHSGPTLRLHIQNPETRTRLFPEDNSYGNQYYEGERPKQIEKTPKPKALPPPWPSTVDRALQAAGIRKATPQAGDKNPDDNDNGKAVSPDQKLAGEFREKAQDIKDYAATIHGLDIDFTPLEQAIGRLDALLNSDWHENVIGASRSSFRRALSDLGFLRDSFKENSQILSIVNQDLQEGMAPETLSADTLEGLKHNFKNVTISVENAVRRALNARISRAEIGVEVHDTRLQIDRLRDVELVQMNTQKMAIDR